MIINNKILEIYKEVEESEAEISILHRGFKASLTDPGDEDPTELYNTKYIETLIELIVENHELNIYDKNIKKIIDLFEEGEFSAAIIEIIKLQDDPKYFKFMKPFERLMDTVQLLLANFKDKQELDEFIKEKEREEKLKREFKTYFADGI